MNRAKLFLILGILCFAEFIYLGILTDFVKGAVIKQYVILAFTCLLLGVTCLIIWKHESNRT